VQYFAWTFPPIAGNLFWSKGSDGDVECQTTRECRKLVHVHYTVESKNRTLVTQSVVISCIYVQSGNDCVSQDFPQMSTLY